MIILRLLLLLTNLHLKLLSRQGTGADKLLSTQRVNIGKKNDDVITFKYSLTEDGNKFDMTRVNEIKDIGVIVDSELKFDLIIHNYRLSTSNAISMDNSRAWPIRLTLRSTLEYRKEGNQSRNTKIEISGKVLIQSR